MDEQEIQSVGGSVKPREILQKIAAPFEGPWYSLLDLLDAKGVPVYKVIDRIDEHVPSVLLAVLGLLLLIALVAFLLTSGSTNEITITVLSGARPIKGVEVSAYSGKSLIAKGETNNKGHVVLSLPQGTIRLEMKRDKCEDLEIEIEVDEPGEREINMDCLTSALFGGCLEMPETLTSARIVGEDNIEPSNCMISATTVTGKELNIDWEIDSTNRLIFSDKQCVEEDNEIYIECDSHSRQATASEIINEARMNGEVLVYASSKTNFGLEAKTLYNFYVTVEDTNGQPIPNIRVIAVDSMGNEYITGYRNTKTSDTTNDDGNAVLRMAEDSEFMIRAEDINAVYAPTISSVLIADDSKEITLTMEKGEKTFFQITSEETPIPGAPLRIKKDGVQLVYTRVDESGSKTLALAKGKYVAESAPKGYVPGSTEFNAGDDVKIQLESLTKNLRVRKRNTNSTAGSLI